MLQLKKQVIKKTVDTMIVVRLDVLKAFDNVKHSAIFESLRALNVGTKTRNYVKNFLMNRTATISLGGQSLKRNKLEYKGTPKGSVLSPTLFDIAMIGLPRKLAGIEELNHTLYVDDLPLWMSRGGDGHIEETLQRAVQATEEYLEPIGLRCSAEKSEVIF